jgi:hypothetical protein
VCPLLPTEVLFLMFVRVVIIPSDEQPIIDDVCFLVHSELVFWLTRFQELKEILLPIPVGCTLVVRSLFDFLIFSNSLMLCPSGRL